MAKPARGNVYTARSHKVFDQPHCAVETMPGQGIQDLGFYPNIAKNHMILGKSFNIPPPLLGLPLFCIIRSPLKKYNCLRPPAPPIMEHSLPPETLKVVVDPSPKTNQLEEVNILFEVF